MTFARGNSEVTSSIIFQALRHKRNVRSGATCSSTARNPSMRSALSSSIRSMLAPHPRFREVLDTPRHCILITVCPHSKAHPRRLAREEGPGLDPGVVRRPHRDRAKDARSAAQGDPESEGLARRLARDSLEAVL